MRMTVIITIALTLGSISRGEETSAGSPNAVVSNFVREISALATNYTELANFPEYVKHAKSPKDIEFEKNINLSTVAFEENVDPVLTKRRISPSDCGTNGIYILFSLDDGTHERQAPIDTITSFDNLKLTLYSEIVLSEKASKELKAKLETILKKHKEMLSELDRKAGDKSPKPAEPKDAKT